MPRAIVAAAVSLAALACSACAFDVIHLKQTPAQYEPVAATDRTWELRDDLKVSIASGWATALKRGTTWRQVGRINEGDVLRTRDQIVTVEASNIHEAHLVIDHGQVVGFFLPVEKSFTPADPPAPITLVLKE